MSAWDRLSGQRRTAAVLQSAASAPGDAYLFAGPPGVGKAEAARVFAAAMLCPDQCGVCSICSRVIRGIHPDVQIFEPEGLTYPVDLIREVVGAAARTPLEAERRVMILEGADRIVERSQNALLKALEEPSRSVTWVLVADSVDPFLPTILSRCRMIEFSPVPEERVAELLQRFDLDAAATEVILRASRGDVELAIALATDGRIRELRGLAIDSAIIPEPTAEWAITSGDKLREAANAARTAREEELNLELQALEETLTSGGGWRKRAVDRHKRILRKVETDVFCSFLVWLAAACRDLAAASSGAGESDLTIRDRSAEILAAAPQRSTGAWIEACQTALDGQLAIVENANPALVVEGVLLSMVTLQRAAGVAQG